MPFPSLLGIPAGCIVFGAFSSIHSSCYCNHHSQELFGRNCGIVWKEMYLAHHCRTNLTAVLYRRARTCARGNNETIARHSLHPCSWVLVERVC